MDASKNGSDFAGCKKSPVTVTREGGVSAPDWRREDAMPRRGRSARELVRESGKGTRSEQKEKEIGVCVLVFGRTRADGEHVPTESTRDASGQQWANARREVVTPFSFSLFIWGLCVSVVEALSGKFSIV